MSRKLFSFDLHHRCFVPLAVFFLSLVMALGFTLVYAQEVPEPPSCPPPGCSPTSPFSQFTLNRILTNGSDASLFTRSTVIGGQLSVGGLTTSALKMTGSLEAGKVLTSDAQGNATWQDTQKELPQITTGGKVLGSNTNGNPSWQDVPKELQTGTTGQTLRHDGTNWVANGALTSDGSSVSVKNLLKVGAANLASGISGNNSHQRYSLGYGIYWDSIQKKYVVTDTQHNQATFSNENGNFTWALHDGKQTGPLIYADWHKNNKMTLSQDGTLTVNGKIKGKQLCIGNDCRGAWDHQWVADYQVLRSKSYYREPLETLTYVKGLVGIGESNPSTTLEVAGDFKVSQAKYTYTKISESTYLEESERSCSCGDDDPMTNLCGKSFTTNKDEGEYCWEIRTFTSGDAKVYRYRRGATPVNMAIYANGSTGNVGIGTSSPTSKLHVGGNVQVDDNITSRWMTIEDKADQAWPRTYFSSKDVNMLVGLNQPDKLGQVAVTSNHPLVFYTDGKARMNIANYGGISIGMNGDRTVNPDAPLHILHNGASSYGVVLKLDQSEIGNSDGPKIAFKKITTTSGNYWDWTLGILNGVGEGSFGIIPAAGTERGFGGNPALVIEPQYGRVGLGTKSPGGNQIPNPILEIMNPTLARIGMSAYAPSDGNQVRLTIDARGDGLNRGQIGTLSNHDLAFRTNNEDRMTLTKNGDVTVGYSTIEYSYTIDETINSRQGLEQCPNNVTNEGPVTCYKREQGVERYYRKRENVTNPNKLIIFGSVGIGTREPSSLFELRKDTGSASGPTLTLYNASGGVGAGGSIDFIGYGYASQKVQGRIRSLDDGAWGGDLAFFTKPYNSGTNGNVGEVMRITSKGTVGIGTSSPTSKLTVQGDTSAPYLLNVGGTLNGRILVRHIDGKHWENTNQDSLYLQWGVNYNTILNGGGSTGRVGIGTDNPCDGCRLDVRGGHINVGDPVATLSGKDKIAFLHDRVGLDVAELFETEEIVEAGDIVVTSSTQDRKLKKSHASYQKTIIGVVSGSPALLFEGSELKIGAMPNRFIKGTKPPVALAGRVPVKVSLENGPIESGDYLTSSAIPGVAMKATRPGTIIGIALEAYKGGKDATVLTLIMNGERNNESTLQTIVKRLEIVEKELAVVRSRQK